MRDTPRYGRQRQHLCLRGISQCVHLQPHPLSVVRILSGRLSCLHLHTHAHWLKFEFFMSSPWPPTCGLFTLNLPVYFLLYFPLFFLFLNYMKSVVNLHNSCNEGVDTNDVLSSPQVMSPGPMISTRPQSSPSCSSWTRCRSSPTKSLLRTPTTMTLLSKTCSTKHIERKLITLYERTCLSVCRRRQCPIEQGDLLEMDRGDSVSTEAQKHRLCICSTIKKSKFLQNAKQELINTNFKQLEPKMSNDSFKDNYGSKSWNFVKFIKEVSLKWKSDGSFRVLHSTLWQDENSSKIRTLYWNFLAENRNCKMKYIV